LCIKIDESGGGPLTYTWGARRLLEVFDIETTNITHTHLFTGIMLFRGSMSIYDIIAIDETHYLLATKKGLLKTTKDQQINHYYKGASVRSLCHITDSLYLVGFYYGELTVWDQQIE
jgi:hypothetical protein